MESVRKNKKAESVKKNKNRVFYCKYGSNFPKKEMLKFKRDTRKNIF